MLIYSFDVYKALDTAECWLLKPAGKIRQPIEKTEENGKIVYTIGERVNGDHLVAAAFADRIWSTEQDVTLTLKYPQKGIGATVSFAKVIVDQSSKLGKAYVTEGGIGQSYITIVIEALHTTYFEHESKIYGY